MSKCPECGVDYEGAEMFCPVDGARLAGAGECLSTLPPDGFDPFLGQVISGRYRVLGRLGEGGMGVVYVAEHVEIEKKVALKILRDDFSKRPEVVERFRQEAKAASRIGHEHIVDVTDFGQLDDGGVYFVMEYLQGQALSDLVEQGPADLPRAVPIIQQIAQALKAAHDLGIVHRDLKPENVFLVERGGYPDFVKVLDFGIAKISDRDSEGQRLTQTGMIFGTPEYMSPEQAAGGDLDHRVDVYALGCIMFEMFTGHTPFKGDTFMAILTQHMFEPIPDLAKERAAEQIPLSVRSVVYKAMAKKADERYASMDALSEDLERALHDANYIIEHPDRETTVRVREAQGQDTPLDWAPETGALSKKKSRAPLVILGVFLLAALAAGGYLFMMPGNDQVAVPLLVANPAPEKTVALAGENQVEPGPVAQNPAAKALAEPARENVPPENTDLNVQVHSDPAGAQLMIEGMGQVCSKTPCDVKLEEGQTYQLLARLDGREGKLVLTPSAQNREVTLVIEEKKPAKSTPRRKPAPRPKKKAGKKPTKTKKDSGLKIPDLFMNQ